MSVKKMPDRDSVINDLNVAKLILCNPQMLTPEMCIRIGQAITSAISLLKEQMPHKETFWDSMSEADLMDPMHHFED